jgi:hypothetical protein
LDAARDVKVDDVGGQAGRRDFKRGAGAGGIFKEKIENTFAAQQRHLLHLAVVHADKVGGRIQYVRQYGFGKAFDGKQMKKLTIFIELRVSSVQHASGSCSASGFFQMSCFYGVQVRRPTTWIFRQTNGSEHEK